MAGLTVGIIAIPLSMALAIASGVPPQHGLYTAFIAGFVIALTGGSRYSISGPTAAFVVILYPVAQQYGLGGLLTAGMMAGFILIAMALLRLGRFIEYIPEAVTLGFTGGIAVVIATLQIKDFFGLPIEALPESYVGKVGVLIESMPQTHWSSLCIALITLSVLILWPKIKSPIPSPLPAVLAGVVASIFLSQQGHPVETIGSRFSFALADGSIGHGIPSVLPQFQWPWEQPDAQGQATVWEWETIRNLLPAAFSIAMLGAIESLLCAVVLDGMTGKRHSANSELLGQGIGNIIVPFFGGITATAALARSTANYQAGAQSPIAAIMHALTVLLALLFLSGFLAYLPMASMAALLIMVARNMSEAPKSIRLIKTAPKGDIWVFLCCFSLTVLFDMVIAITCGIILAAVLFIKEMAEMTKMTEVPVPSRWISSTLPDNWKVIRINGPLFYAAADRVFSELALSIKPDQNYILYLEAVPVLDGGGLAALEKFISACHSMNGKVIISELQFQPLKTIRKASIEPIDDKLMFTSNIDEAIEAANLEGN